MKEIVLAVDNALVYYSNGDTLQIFPLAAKNSGFSVDFDELSDASSITQFGDGEWMIEIHGTTMILETDNDREEANCLAYTLREWALEC